MPRLGPTRRLLGVALAGALLSASAAARAPIARTVYFSAFDASGAPVTTLAPADLLVKEGGKERPVDAVVPASTPLDVAIIVDDGGTGAFQSATAQLLNTLMGHGQFALRLVNTQALRIQDYTSDLETLRAAVGKLGQRARVTPDGDQLLEGVAEAAKELQKRQSAHPAIVVFTVHGEAHKAIDPENVLTDLRKSGASLHVLYVTGALTGQMIGDGTTQSGGRVEEVGAGAGIVPAAARIADTLLHQFMLTYTLPEGVKRSDRLSLTSTRKDIVLLAPTRIADK